MIVVVSRVQFSAKSMILIVQLLKNSYTVDCKNKCSSVGQVLLVGV